VDILCDMGNEID